MPTFLDFNIWTTNLNKNHENIVWHKMLYILKNNSLINKVHSEIYVGSQYPIGTNDRHSRYGGNMLFYMARETQTQMFQIWKLASIYFFYILNIFV